MKKNMTLKIKLSVLLTVGVLGFSSQIFADQAQMNESLVRLVNQLDALLPLVDAAEREQPQNERFTFHFSSFEGSDGHPHNGLREDIMSMKEALIVQINQPAIDPETVAPLNNDFIGDAP